MRHQEWPARTPSTRCVAVVVLALILTFQSCQSGSDANLRLENEALRARVAALERELKSPNTRTVAQDEWRETNAGRISLQLPPSWRAQAATATDGFDLVAVDADRLNLRVRLNVSSSPISEVRSMAELVFHLTQLYEAEQTPVIESRGDLIIAGQNAGRIITVIRAWPDGDGFAGRSVQYVILGPERIHVLSFRVDDDGFDELEDVFEAIAKSVAMR